MYELCMRLGFTHRAWSEVYLLGGGLGLGILFSTAAISFLSSKFFHWS